ncbi:MAG: cache domain-containing protein [Planctomycetaceae bacterium]|nr:cache domain-containing protein [Planctomycetaceae bacterium]
MKIFILKPWHRIALHVILPVALTAFLFAGSLFFYNLPNFRRLLYEDNERFIREMVDIVSSLAQNYQSRVESGELTLQEAQNRFKERLRTMRYGPGKGNYFWINDLNARLIMHPYLSELEGKDVSDLADINGKRFVAEFSRVGRQQGGGYVEYMWQWHDDPNRIVPKIGYVRLFEPWGWVIGTSIYIQEVRSEIDRLTRVIHRNTAIIYLIVIALCGYVVWQGVRTEMERQRVQDDLRNSFERFKTVLDSLDAIVYVSDIFTHEVLFVNKCGLEKASGASGQYCWEILGMDQGQPCESCDMRELMDRTRQPHVPIRQIHDVARDRWYECRDQLIRWVDGRDVCLEVASDITDRKRAEQEREGLMRKLALKNEELQSIVYATSHDLRSPLINIEGFSRELGNSCGRLADLLRNPESLKCGQTILKSILEEDIPESLDFIFRNTEKMQTLVNGLLQLSRIGTAKLDFKSLDMNALLSNVLASCNYQIKTIDAQVTVESLPPAFGDYSQINQVFANLIDNALKYRQKDCPLVIRITGRRLDGMVEYTVTDNGIGIAQMHLGRIFELFQQLKPSVNPSEGVGLGLTIVKRIVDIHNGGIRVESIPGEGTTFFITLPKG